MRTWNDYVDVCEQMQALSSVKAEFLEIPKVSVVGCFQNGKSTFINCLLEKFVARIGDGTATTSISSRYQWGKEIEINIRSNDGELIPVSLASYLYESGFRNIARSSAFQAEINLPRHILKKICLVDTPGFNANQDDTENALRSLEEANYAIIVLTNERTIGDPEKIMFQYIAERSIPYAVIMNCKDKIKCFPSSSSNERIILENESILKTLGYEPEKIIEDCLIYPCNFLWYWLATDSYLESREFLPQAKTIEREVNLFFEEEEIITSKANLIKESWFLPIKSFFETRFAALVQPNGKIL
jgi:GTP-binding protein EngB required for normal cell division